MIKALQELSNWLQSAQIAPDDVTIIVRANDPNTLSRIDLKFSRELEKMERGIAPSPPRGRLDQMEFRFFGVHLIFRDLDGGGSR